MAGDGLLSAVFWRDGVGTFRCLVMSGDRLQHEKKRKRGRRERRLKLWKPISSASDFGVHCRPNFSLLFAFTAIGLQQVSG